MVTTTEKHSPTNMKNNKTLILCSCDSSLKYDPEAFKSQGFDDVILTDQLCGNDLDVAVAALSQRDQVVFACEQQSQIFEQLTEELHAENALQGSLDLIDLRDRAGWTAQGEKESIVEAKQLALLADAALDRPGTKAPKLLSWSRQPCLQRFYFQTGWKASWQKACSCKEKAGICQSCPEQSGLRFNPALSIPASNNVFPVSHR